jgi:hypothetical protein
VSTLKWNWTICAHFDSKLSQAIRDDTISIRDALPTLQASTIAINANVDTLHAGTQAIKEDSLLIRDAQSLQQHNAIMEWLSPTNFPAQQHDIINRRQEGTGQWFLDSPEFKRWLQGANETIFCPGIPGAGKTMMSAITIDYLHRTVGWCDDIAVAYLFCSYKAQADQSASSLLTALLKQLVQSRPEIAALVTHIYDNHSKQNSRPSIDEIIRILLSICSNYTTVYVIVDALDECSDRDGTRGRLINTLRELQSRIDLRLFFTSRFIPETTQKFQSDLRLEVRASEVDVRRFVAGQIPRLPNCIRDNDDLKRTVENEIVNAVDGM